MTYPPPRTKAGEQYIAAIIRAEGFEGSAPEGLARKAILAIEAEARAGLDVDSVWIVARKSDGEAMAVYSNEADANEDVTMRHRRHRDRYKVEAWQVLGTAAYGGQREEGRLREALDYDALRVAWGWPTPISMRHAADALDQLVIPRYGDVLRWFADRCDEWVWHVGDAAATERLEQARAALRESGEPR